MEGIVVTALSRQSALSHTARTPFLLLVTPLNVKTLPGRLTFAGFPNFCPMTFHLFAS